MKGLYFFYSSVPRSIPVPMARPSCIAFSFFPKGQDCRSFTHFSSMMRFLHKYMPLQCAAKCLALTALNEYLVKRNLGGRKAPPSPRSENNRCPSALALGTPRWALAGEAHNISQLTELQRINFIGHTGSISLLALARDLGWCEDWSCHLVQSGGDFVDVVQADHGEDEATGHRYKGHSISGHTASLVPPRADTSIRERIQTQIWENGEGERRENRGKKRYGGCLEPS